ncbi:glycosyltransferase family 2 protein [Riemerella anatipestifer]|nr:glycosyltransferase family 2 protein [Riemerella anatipestifer]
MKFSILVAHYNNYNYFLDCYKSITNQTHQNFEVILVDDCSNDGSLEKIQNLVKNDIRFKVFKNDENKGVGYTKRKCIELATGDICGFVDPDDALTKEAIAKSIEVYEENKQIVATYSRFYICDEYLSVKHIFKNTKKVRSGNPFFFNINLEIAHFFTFRKDKYLETEGIIPEYKLAEDQDLYLKLYEKGKIFYINQPLLFYRVHNKGLSHDSNRMEMKTKYWHQVLYKATERRKITTLYGVSVKQIECLPKFLFEKENSFLKKLIRKFIK